MEEPETKRGPRRFEVLLEFPGLLAAYAADPHRVIPTPGGDGTPLLRAVFAHALTASAAVVDGEARGRKVPLAAAAGLDVLVWDPVGRTCGFLHQAWKTRRF